MKDLKTSLSCVAMSVEQTLDTLLFFGGGPEDRVVEAMRYAVFNGGKRIRPFLVVACAEMFDVDRQSVLPVAAALEMVHCYSLIHDDLPAMDNDVLRRGKPTCHIQFDEATAILAGDALLTYSFSVLTNPHTHQNAKIRADLVFALAEAVGQQGMVGGQMLDIIGETESFNMSDVSRMQHMKTGMLISVACEMGAILGNASEHERIKLRAYSHDLGLAFQIIDDLLDMEGEEYKVGKKTGKDINAGKSTLVSIMGVDQAREQALFLTEQAIGHLAIFAEKSKLLKQIARFTIERDR